MNSDIQKKTVICIGSIASGSGKTTVALGLMSYLTAQGLKVQPFKCGPDYIDTEFHKDATGRESINLDSWMMRGEKQIINSFAKAMKNADCAVIEGVMGLFDSVSPDSIEGSTAHIAKILNVPVLLVINSRGMANTIAPIVKGFIDYEDGVRIAGIIANNVGSPKHAQILSKALAQQDKLPPLLGYIERTPELSLPERHLGLVPAIENKKQQQWYEKLGEIINNCFDINSILQKCSIEIPQTTTRMQPANKKSKHIKHKYIEKRPLIAYAYDDAFHFYYPDNFDIFRDAGIKLMPFSPLHDKKLPDNISGIYIGGGFPEMFADKLSDNIEMRKNITEFAENNGFIYAECGGFMYLAKQLKTLENKILPMCGIYPNTVKMNNRLQKLGYVIAEFIEDSPFGTTGARYRGHEFHWSSVTVDYTQNINPMCKIFRPKKNNSCEYTGVHIKNVWASYIHAHFASNPEAVRNLYNFLTQHSRNQTRLSAETKE